MLISLCIPCHNRAYDLKVTLPISLASANASPPVEIVLVDYNSPDDLSRVVSGMWDKRISYYRYTGRDYYHMAHARNLTIRGAHGDCIVILSADIALAPGYLPYVRKAIKPGVFLYVKDYRGVIMAERRELIEAGGYDERFEYYGSEDRELHERLERRGLVAQEIPADLLHVIRTPDDVKVKNYREPLSKREMHAKGKAILQESRERMTLVANPEGWGAWT